jgi:hypothetical protein
LQTARWGKLTGLLMRYRKKNWIQRGHGDTVAWDLQRKGYWDWHWIEKESCPSFSLGRNNASL